MKIQDLLQENKPFKKETDTKMTEEKMIDREELLQQKQRVEKNLSKFDRKNIDDKILSSLRKMKDVNDAISDLQYSLNIVWKRTKQIEEELNEALSMPFEPSHPQQYPQQ